MTAGVRCALAVVLDVVRRRLQQIWVVAEETQSVVAPLTQQRPDPPGVMVMIQVLGR
jgi:hypothetical protein